jgi:hypothetical protein
MFYRLLADAVVVLHLSFIIFIVFGGILVLRWRRWAWFHLPAASWGVFIEFAGWICPLTPLENWLRAKGNSFGYSTSFIEHYIIPVIYPTALTRELQLWLGTLVLAFNIGIYVWILHRRVKRVS